MRKLLALAFMAVGCSAQVNHVSGNFSYDLIGQADTRPDTWGRHASDARLLTFNPPAGQRVRILSIVGDLTARWVTLGAIPQPGRYTGVLAAVHKQESSGSLFADLAADGHFLYVQGDIGDNGVLRVPFDVVFDESDPGALLDTPVLVFKAAKYLDETGYATHMEITFSQINFRYETP